MLSESEIAYVAQKIVDLIKPCVAPPTALLTKADIATAWHVTTATIDRLVRRGMPVQHITSSAPRFDRQACEAWCRANPAPARPTNRAPLGDVVSLEGVRPLGRRRA